jgi:osmotically inducible protein OsmC
MSARYTAVVTGTSGRSGRVRSEDGNLDLAVTVPAAVGGPGGEGTNPEELFAAGYAACFGSAVRAAAARESLSAREAAITAKVSLVQTENKTFGLAVELVGHFPDLNPDQAMVLMRGGHEICPYSQATRGNIEVTLSVV